MAEDKSQSKNYHPPLMAGVVMAGFPSPAEQYVESPLDLNELLVKNPVATFFVRAEGDSMINAGIQSGDILIVDRSIQPYDGAIVIAAVNNEFTVKYLRQKNNQTLLEAANPEYEPIVFNEGEELRIFGVVTSAIHQFIKAK